LAAGEIVALVLVPLFAWVPCESWLAWAGSCPPNVGVVAGVSTVAYLCMVGLLRWAAGKYALR